MVQPSKPTSDTLQNYQGIGVPEANRPRILQRGGDELLLSKTDGWIAAVKSGRSLYRSIADASWYALTQKLEYVAAKSGKKLYRVDPRHTSAIERASRGGFLSGFPGLKFGPNQNLTKSEAIVSLVNGLELKAGNPDSLKVYSDRSLISTPLSSSGVKSNQQSILQYHSVFRPPLQQSTVNSQQ